MFIHMSIYINLVYKKCVILNMLLTKWKYLTIIPYIQSLIQCLLKFVSRNIFLKDAIGQKTSSDVVEILYQKR